MLELQTELLAADAAGMARAAELLRGGRLVALPTETVYGLGANAFDDAAVAKIFAAKQRPSWDPLIVHVCDRTMLERVAVLAGACRERAERLMEALWPGPLTMLLPRSEAIPAAVTAGRALAGVRMPSHPVALEVIRRAGIAVAAPSANRFGRTSPTSAMHVLEDLDGRIDAVLDGGVTTIGIESTVLDVCASPMVIYRSGAVTPEQIEQVAGAVCMFAAESDHASAAPESLPSPGVGLRHYAPRARLLLVRDEAEMQSMVVALGMRSGLVFCCRLAGLPVMRRCSGGLTGTMLTVWLGVSLRACVSSTRDRSRSLYVRCRRWVELGKLCGIGWKRRLGGADCDLSRSLALRRFKD